MTNGKLSCEIITFGATIRSLVVPDRNGNPVDVVLGYDTLEEYASQDGYLGATVGRFANRIAKGRFQLNGQTYTFATNNGNNHLHGGLQGFSHRVWTIDHSGKCSATLSLTSPDGEEGYPGNLTCTIQFELDNNALIIHFHAASDKDTLCNLTNHSYFNLSGHNSGPVQDQNIQIYAQHYTPSDAESIPFGTVTLDLLSLRDRSRIVNPFWQSNGPPKNTALLMNLSNFTPILLWMSFAYAIFSIGEKSRIITTTLLSM